MGMDEIKEREENSINICLDTDYEGYELGCFAVTIKTKAHFRTKKAHLNLFSSTEACQKCQSEKPTRS